MKKAVLVEPEVAENTGFIARLAHNFEYDLRVVNPDFNLRECRKTANKAQQKLREARIFDSVEKAVEDLDFVVGTKPGKGVRLEEFQPRDNTSVMLGRESSGLSNSELDVCDAVVHIETAGYESLNLSHASAVVFNSLNSRSKSQGADEEALRRLEQIAGEKTAEAVKASNPSASELNRIIGELK